jgi:AcrR family transcriptional regulator
VRTVDPVRHAARRAAIQDAAAVVFAERGYTGATTAQICRAAGIGSGTLFHYFGDKRSIMLAIITDDQTVNDAVIATLDEAQALEEVWRLLDHLCRDAADPYAPGLVGAMLQLAVNDEEFAGLLEQGDERVRAALARLLVRAAADGSIDSSLGPARTARWLVGLVDALYLMCGEVDFDARAEAAELRRIAARYLAAHD